MDLADVHGTAAAILRAAGYDEDDVPGSIAIARALLGTDCIVRGAGAAAAVSLAGRPRIRLPRRRSPVEINFLVAHELAEHWLRREAYQSEHIEDVANAIAASLVAPRCAFARAVREHGHDYPMLAALFCATESLVVLRIGEVTGEPIALVAPHRVRTRGQLSFQWGSEQDVRELARSQRPGLRKTRLRDDPRRVAVTVG